MVLTTTDDGSCLWMGLPLWTSPSLKTAARLGRKPVSFSGIKWTITVVQGRIWQDKMSTWLCTGLLPEQNTLRSWPQTTSNLIHLYIRKQWAWNTVPNRIIKDFMLPVLLHDLYDLLTVFMPGCCPLWSLMSGPKEAPRRISAPCLSLLLPALEYGFRCLGQKHHTDFLRSNASKCWDCSGSGLCRIFLKGCGWL